MNLHAALMAITRAQQFSPVEHKMFVTYGGAEFLVFYEIDPEDLSCGWFETIDINRVEVGGQNMTEHLIKETLDALRDLVQEKHYD